MAIMPLAGLYSSAETDWSTMLSLSTGRESVRLHHLVAAFIPNQGLKDDGTLRPAELIIIGLWEQYELKMYHKKSLLG